MQFLCLYIAVLLLWHNSRYRPLSNLTDFSIGIIVLRWDWQVLGSTGSLFYMSLRYLCVTTGNVHDQMRVSDILLVVYVIYEECTQLALIILYRREVIEHHGLFPLLPVQLRRFSLFSRAAHLSGSMLSQSSAQFLITWLGSIYLFACLMDTFLLDAFWILVWADWLGRFLISIICLQI